MNLGGIQKSSLIDYPGKVSCVLFLSGCNFHCPYCHNPDLARGRAQAPDLAEGNGLFSFLEKRTGFLDAVVISGGEPTLQADLEAICRRIKQMGYPVKLDTNGSRPEVLERLLDQGLVDFVAMDVKTAPHRYCPDLCTGIAPSTLLSAIETVMTKAPDYEFRTTCVRPLVDEQAVAQIAGCIAGARRYALQHFEKKCVLCPEYFDSVDPELDGETLQRLRNVAAPHVQHCILR